MEFENLVKWIFRIIAMIMAWRCNFKEYMILRVGYTLVAGYLGHMYLFYYAFVHGVLGVSCVTPVWL